MDCESSRSHDKLAVILQDQSQEPQKLPLEYLREITNNFSDERLLGNGGFGYVYKGVKQNGDTIAVKKLMASMPGIQDSQFENEVHHLMKLKHSNIVKLVGYCSVTERIPVPYEGKYVYAEKSERLLCLEYLPKGSLSGHLSDEKSGLDWDTRYRIIQGICNGLHYLHKEWKVNTPIIHMDLKPPNILLDDNMVPKIADFGLSRLFGEEQTRTCTKNCRGTVGYMAPEYINRGIITKKLDIFSLGVIIIEIMTGRKDYPYETETSSKKFTELVLKNWINRLENALGYAFRESYPQIRRCIEIGLACVKVDWEERPTTCQIIKLLHGSEGAEYNNERVAPPILPLDSQLSLDDLHAIKLFGVVRRKCSSGIVQLVRHKWTGQFYALKVIQLIIQDDRPRQIAQQLKISLSIQCQYVVTCYQVFYVNGVLSIVLEYMDGGSLAEFLEAVKTIPEYYLAAICKQVLKGLIYLHHEKHIIHRDLKPSNILINHRGEVKISDFSTSAITSSYSAQRDTFTGTYTYMAPERICGAKYGNMCDIWSFGLVMLECATGSFPFPHYESFYELLEAIVDQPPPSAESDQFSPEFCSFISACIQKDPKDRSSAQVLLAHPFLSMYDDMKIDLASYFTEAGSPLATFQ